MTTITRTERNNLVKIASYSSICVAALLLTAKAYVWWITDSVSLFASFLDSFLDLGASCLNMVAIRTAIAPPDKEHRFGHGKAEALSALGQGALITASSFWLGYEVISRLTRPQPAEKTLLGILVMLFAILVSVGLVCFQRYVIKKTASTAIKADAAHYQTDILINGGVIFSLTVSHYTGILWIDPLCGGAIALYIFYTAWEIFKESVNILMDREADPEIRKKIEKIALSHPDVSGVHDIRTRSSGAYLHIQLHLEMNGDLTLLQSHDISDTVYRKLLSVFPHSDIIIHQDPSGIQENRDHF